MNAGASALVLLAWKRKDELDNLLRRPLGYFSPHTLTDRDAIRQSLDRIRTAGSALTVSDVDEDAVGIAVPVVASGEVVAGLSLVAPRANMGSAQLHRAQADLRVAASSIAEKYSLAHTL
ncbi:hypothetical protein GCM10009808_24930 [Microbacterium sediminicola]|uniref:IclR-ED domain-containing protein n=1 Tax=Microbacterium sediminicola TaxID=415210 RepID=A0ABN2IIY8_9MICO